MTREQLKQIKERCEERSCPEKHLPYRWCHTCRNTCKLKPQGATVEETKALIAEIERMTGLIEDVVTATGYLLSRANLCNNPGLRVVESPYLTERGEANLIIQALQSLQQKVTNA